MKTEELRAKSLKELEEKVVELRRLQLKHRVGKLSGADIKPHLVKQLRTTVARVKTIITEKEAKD